MRRATCALAAAVAGATGATGATGPTGAALPPVTYEHVAIGGGGYVAGIITTPRSAVGTPQVYFRTDVGGIARLLNRSNGDSGPGEWGVHGLRWAPLSDRFTYAERNWYGGDALAVSATNSSRVWTSTGAYFEADELAAGIWASEDRGTTWRLISPSGWGVYAGSNNSTYRSSGERLAVHPVNESIVLYGSYLDGLWRTENAQSPAPTWTQVPPASLPWGAVGAVAVAFDPASPGGNTAYAGVGGLGVYISLDAGLTWSGMPGSPSFVHRFALAVAFQQSEGDDGCGLAGEEVRCAASVRPSAPGSSTVLWASTMSGVWRTDGAAWPSTTWSESAQPLGSIEFRGLDVNPWDPLDVVALSHVDDPTPSGLVRTLDGGATWTLEGPKRELYQLPWWSPSFGNNGTAESWNWGMAATLQFSPFSPGQAWIGDSWNAWLAVNFDDSKGGNGTGSTPVAWWQEPYGHEETFILALAAPHAGSPLISGTADLAGFVHPSLDLAGTYPSFSWFGGEWGWGAEGVGIDYTEALTADGAAPLRLVAAHTRVWSASPPGQDHGVVYASEDGGLTWRLTGYNSSDNRGASLPMGVAIGSWDPDAIVVLVENEVAWTTGDGGGTWARAQGLPAFSTTSPFSGNRYNMSRPLAADRSTTRPAQTAPSVFYYADCMGGRLYVSRDGGASFTQGGPFPPSPRCDTVAVSATGGRVWVALDKEGLWVSEDFGATVAKVPDVLVAHTIAVGAPPPGASGGAVGTVYIFGLVEGAAAGDYRVFASLVEPGAGGGEWVDLASSDGAIGVGNWPEVMAASRREGDGFGIVVVGSFGTGALVANASAALMAAAAAAGRGL
jgi:xyloglucan-specific exo-beta-1,4-glucanase